MSRDFCVSEEKSVAGDEGVSGFGGVPTRSEGADNCVCDKGKKGGEANVEDTLMFSTCNLADESELSNE
ncbi:uncharacterized protein MONOS_17521 [Monocercomonoides exilis]|uniref:uncharacterized protein n=1 Tax=Monocercomonoides exilis TaxID=2049356 RepID=UPI00355A2562|nr:hypothetical protein MONOS_17521 [Monocercomonoides exilis]